MKLRRSLELFTVIGLYIGTVIAIQSPKPHEAAPRLRIAENDHAPAAIEELPDQPVAAIPRSRDPEPTPSEAESVPDRPVSVQQAEPVQQQPALAPQQVQRQYAPVCQPQPPCRRRGLGGLFQWLSPLSDD